MTDQRERVEEFSKELRDESGPSDRSIKEIVQALQPQVQELVNKQVELAKSEVTPVAKRAGIATGLLAAAGVVALVFLILLSFTGVYALATFSTPVAFGAHRDRGTARYSRDTRRGRRQHSAEPGPQTAPDDTGSSAKRRVVQGAA